MAEQNSWLILALKLFLTKKQRGARPRKFFFSLLILLQGSPHQHTGASFLFETFFVLAVWVRAVFFLLSKVLHSSSSRSNFDAWRFFFQAFCVARPPALRARSRKKLKRFRSKLAVAGCALSLYRAFLMRTLLAFQFLCMCVPVSQSAECTFEY